MRRLAARFLPLLAVGIVAIGFLRAQTPTGARFTATSSNVSGAGEAIRINITEWSPDSRRDEFVGAWTLTATAPQGRGGRGGAGGGAGRGGAGGGAARGGAAAAGGRGAAGRGGRGG